MSYRKKLIEVALPLEAINVASAREKSIRHGHPSTLHLWWARRPLAAARAVIFTSLVDDPDDPDALPAFVEACRKLPIGANVKANGDTPRMRLFDFIEKLVTWEATTDEDILNTARELIMIATEGNPPPLLDPFAGGGSIPLEAQRLGLEAHASDLNPVAVMINKAQIEIPPRFANMPPVNPRDREKMFGSVPLTPKSPLPQGARGLESTVDAPERIAVPPELQEVMKEIARKLRREQTVSEQLLWQALRNRKLDNRKFRRQQSVGAFVLDFYCADERLAVEVDGSIHDYQREADVQRQEILESLGIRFVRVSAEQVENDLDTTLTTIRAAFLPSPQRGRGAGGEGNTPSPQRGRGAGGEGDTTWRGASGLAADVRYYGEWMREKAWERIGHLYPKYHPSTSGRGNEGEGGETVIAWLWARTVQSPNPAVNAHVPLVRSFILSKKKGRECWAKPIITPVNPSSQTLLPQGAKGFNDSPLPDVGEGPGVRGQGGAGQPTHTIRFEVTQGTPPKGKDGTVVRTGATDIISGEPIPFEYIREEGKAGRMGAMLMAIVTEGQNGRSYYSPDAEHAHIAESAEPEWIPAGDIPEMALGFRVQLYGMDEYNKLFTPRQLVALTTFSDLVHEAREQAYQDALNAGLPDDDIPLREGGRGALAYAEAVSVYLAFALSRATNRSSTISIWNTTGEKIEQVFARQAIPMSWDYPESNPFSDSTGNWMGNMDWIGKALETTPSHLTQGYAVQQDAAQISDSVIQVIATDPPYYDNIGYADLSDYFYVWMRKSLRDVYPEIFGTMLVPKELELIASPYRHGGKEAANEHFESGMLQTFGNIRRFISHDYPLTVYYAFKQQDAEAVEEEEPLTLNPSPTRGEEEPLTLNPSPTRGEGLQNSPHATVGEGLQNSPHATVGEGLDSPSPRSGRGGRGVRVASTGWETMLTSLIDSGFSIDGTWPIRTERSGGVKASVNALASSIVLVCRPRPEDAPNTSRRAFLDDLRRELPAALKAMQSGNIAPVDLAQASIGPGMAIYSRYSQVLEADGSAMRVRTALGLINAALDEYLAEQDGDIDPDTRFAVAWFEQFGFNEGEFGMADVLARAKNTSVAGVEAAGLVVSGRGKVKLKHWTEYDPSNAPLTLNPSPTRGEGLETPLAPRGVGEGSGVRGKPWDPTQDKRPTVWEATHHLIERLNSHGETGSALLMQKMPSDMAAEARQLAYRLYSICERKSWADHARDYNALVISWSGIGEEAARLRDAAQAGQGTRQMGLGGEFEG